ncbi:MAG: TIGR04255 family protein, partial [Anaerolineales bacterium]
AFRESAFFLRNKLTTVYKDFNFKPQDLILRFRSGFPFTFSTGDLKEYLSTNLNLNIEFPEHIPGPTSSKGSLTSTNQVYTFDIAEPKGTGKIQLATAVGNIPESLRNGDVEKGELVVLEIDFASGGVDLPSFANDADFGAWLDSAHALIHEWFFSLIDGELYSDFV